MKIIHCPRGEDPLTYARGARRGRAGLSGLLQGNGLVIGLIVAMVIGTFTIGPLGPKQNTAPETPAPVAVEAGPVSAPVVYVEPVLCTLPAGGMIEPGWESFIQDDERIIHVRCEDDGTLKEIETTG